MKLLELKDINRRHSEVHYRKEISGFAVFSDIRDRTIEKQIEFTLEHDPRGEIMISVRLLEEIDYPLIPTLNSLKSHIYTMEKKGQLP